MTPVYEELVGVAGADEAILPLAERLANVEMLRGNDALAQSYNDRALTIAEAREEWERVVSF